MKPRYRYTASGSWQFLTQDGYVPSVSVSGVAHQSLPRCAAGLASHDERQVFIGSRRLALAFGSNCFSYSQNLAGGFGSQLFPELHHVSLPHGENTVTLRFAKVRNVHG